jgi:hypothetical protein
VSKMDEIKGKIKRDPRSTLMGNLEKTNINVNENNNIDVNVHNNVHDNVDINNNVNKNDNISVNVDYLKELVEGKVKNKKDELINTGIYFEPQVYSVLMAYAKKGGRGAKSRIVNDTLKSTFIQMGLMKDE